jgi:histidyl-tRNA synthetase
VELIAFAYDLFTKLGIPDECYSVEVNSIGCPECRVNFQNELRKYYEQFKGELCVDCLERLQRNPMRLLDCKVTACGMLKGNAPMILDYNCDSCNDFFNKFTDGLNSLGIPYLIEPQIVRGLDYYTNTVFEFVTNGGLVFGAGGRYNGLIKELGGAPTPASGFALGIERIVSVVGDGFGAPKAPDIYIAGLGERASSFALKLARDLRKAGLQAECDIVGRSVKAQMRYADKIGARYSVVIGDDELEKGIAVLKNMETKETDEAELNSDGIFEKISE